MAFPDDVMTADEKVVLHLRPHWKVMIMPTVVVLLAVAAVVTALAMGWDKVMVYIVACLSLVAVAIWSFWPWLVWRTTHYVFTNERIIFQFGVFSRDRRDIPLMRVNDHAMSQSFLERILGCGVLTIESAGERGQSVLRTSRTWAWCRPSSTSWWRPTATFTRWMTTSAAFRRKRTRPKRRSEPAGCGRRAQDGDVSRSCAACWRTLPQAAR